MKVVATDQANKVRKLLTKNKKHSPYSRIKSKSPIGMKKIVKETKCDQWQSQRNNGKSLSPNPDEKKSNHKMQHTKKAMNHKSPLGSNNILNMGVNSSGEAKKIRIGKK